MDRQIDANQIKWIKNVKRAGGQALAYANENRGRSFLLHWSSYSAADKPQEGDIILLFQNYHNKGILFTHLVEIESREVIPDPDNGKYVYGRWVKVLYYAENILKPSHFRFSNLGFGNTHEIGKINTTISASQIQEEVLTLFTENNPLSFNIETLENGYKVHIPPNKLYNQTQIIETSNRIITMIGQNGAGKSTIMERIFEASKYSQVYNTICFTSGQNERYSALFQIMQKEKKQEIYYLQKNSSADYNSLINRDVQTFYFHKEWSRLLIFFSIVFNEQGKSAQFVDEFNLDSSNLHITLPIRILTPYIKYINSERKNEEKGNPSATLNSDFFQKLGQLISTVYPDYDFEKGLTVDLQLDIQQATSLFEEKNINFLFNFFWQCIHGNYRLIDPGNIRLYFDELELKDISDGEYQLLSLTALLELFDQPHTNFLLDELDSHLYYHNISRMWNILRSCQGFIFTTTHISDSILNNELEDLKFVEKGEIKENLTFKEITARLAELTGIEKYEYKLAAKFPHIVLIDDIIDWKIFTLLAEIKIPHYDASLINSIQPIKCSHDIDEVHKALENRKVYWTKGFCEHVYDNKRINNNIFMISDRDNLPLSHIKDKVLVKKYNGPAQTYLMVWSRREIENYLLSYSMLEKYEMIEQVNKEFGEIHQLKPNQTGDGDWQIQTVDIKDQIRSLYHTEDGRLDEGKMKEVIQQIPAAEISEDIENMYNFMVSKINP